MATVQMGYSFRSRLEASEGGGVAVIHMKDLLDDNTVGCDDLVKIDLDAVKEHHLAQRGNLVFRSRGHVTTAAILVFWLKTDINKRGGTIMSYHYRTVSRNLLKLCDHKGGGDCSPLKLFKLLYFANAIFLVKTDKKLITQTFQAWKHGPVIPELYRELKRNNNNVGSFGDEQLSKDDMELLDRELSSLVNKDAWELRNMSHRMGPWKEYYELGVPYIQIPTDAIKSDFKKILENRRHG